MGFKEPLEKKKKKKTKTYNAFPVAIASVDPVRYGLFKQGKQPICTPKANIVSGT